MKKTSKPAPKKSAAKKPAAKSHHRSPNAKRQGRASWPSRRAVGRHFADRLGETADRLVASSEKLALAADTLVEMARPPQPPQQPHRIDTQEALADLTAPAVDMSVDDATDEE